MKVILSRKGFDETAGGIASPILPGGKLLSLPIPDSNGRDYNSLRHDNVTYAEIIEQLRERHKTKFEYTKGHLDPDVRRGVFEAPEGWKAAFGQCDGALSHLINEKAEVGDLFLFYGWFKQTVEQAGKLRFETNARNIHIVYGYLQIGQIVTDRAEIASYHWHPHAGMATENNCLFVASDSLTCLGSVKKGYGMLTYDKRRVLTKDSAKNRSEWGELPALLKKYNLRMSRQRQEHVIQEHPAVTDWARSLIEC